MQGLSMAAVLLLAAGWSVPVRAAGPDDAGNPPGQAEGAAQRSLDAVIADLGAPEFEVRERASAELRDRGATLEELEGLLVGGGGDKLSPEQRARVSEVAREVFSQSPRAAMGVSFGLLRGFEAPASPLTISNVFEQFPSSRVLKAGDDLVAVAGVSVRGLTATGGLGMDCVRPYIICHDPGDVVKMTVIRGGEEVTLDVPLGRFSNLPVAGGNMEQLASADLAAAWKLRLGSRAGALANVLQAPVLPALEDRLAGAIDRELNSRAQEGEGLAAGIVSGGDNRDNDTSGLIDPTRQAKYAVTGDPRFAREQVRRLNTQLVRIDEQIMEQTKLLIQPQLSDRERLEAQQLRIALMQQRMSVQAQIEGLRLQMEGFPGPQGNRRLFRP